MSQQLPVTTSGPTATTNSAVTVASDLSTRGSQRLVRNQLPQVALHAPHKPPTIASDSTSPNPVSVSTN